MREQLEFDDKYITSIEICAKLGIQRSTMFLAIKTNRMPRPIVIKRDNGKAHVMLWERIAVTPVVDEWAQALVQRKGGAN